MIGEAVKVGGSAQHGMRIVEVTRTQGQAIPPPQVQMQQPPPHGQQVLIPGLDGITVDALKGLLVQFGMHANVVPEEAASPFSTAVRESPLPLSFQGTGDLRYNVLLIRRSISGDSQQRWSFIRCLI